MTPRTIDDACSYGVKFFDRLGVKTVEEARKLDASYIREVYAKFRETESFFFTPMIDNVFQHDEPLKLFMQGKHAHVPLMSGNTFDEFPSFILADSKDEFEGKAKEIFGGKASEFLSFPEAQKHNGNMYAPVRAIECAVKATFEHNDKPGYYYSFEPDIPGEDNPGTFHSVDLWIFFDNLDKCWRPMTGRSSRTAILTAMMSTAALFPCGNLILNLPRTRCTSLLKARKQGSRRIPPNQDISTS